MKHCRPILFLFVALVANIAEGYNSRLKESKISVGKDHTCAINKNGAIDCYGSDKKGKSNGWQPRFPVNPKTGKGRSVFTQVDVFTDHTCGLSFDGAIECFGDWEGLDPQWPSKGGRYVHLSTGPGKTCGVTDSGSIQCLGQKPLIIRPVVGEKFTQVSVGTGQFCGLVSDGTIYFYDYGQTQPTIKTPKEPGDKYVQVVSQYGFFCGLTNKGKVECDGVPPYYIKNIENKFDFTQISMGGSHFCGVTTKSSIKCYGHSDGNPVKFPESSENFVQVSVGADENGCALDFQGNMVCTGKQVRGRNLNKGGDWWTHPEKVYIQDRNSDGKYKGREKLGFVVYCKDCAAGKFSDVQNINCVNCAAGRFSNGKSACSDCKEGKYSLARASTCSLCPRDRPHSPLRSGSIDFCGVTAKKLEEGLISSNERLESMSKVLQHVVEKTIHSEVARAHLQRQWAEEMAIAEYNRRDLRQFNFKTERLYCDYFHKTNKGKERPIAVSPAVEMKDEDDKINCLNLNRDNAVNAYCTFRKKFDRILADHGVSKTSKDLWPNVCCASIPGDCKASYGIKQVDMIPFAMAQGGEGSENDLWSEMYQVMSKGGHFHKGMLAALDQAKRRGARIDTLRKKLDVMFEKVNLCGPRVFFSPLNPEVQLCQMLHAYHHMFQSFADGFLHLFHTQDTKGLENSRRRLLGLKNRAVSGRMDAVNPMVSMMASKQKKSGALNTKVSNLERKLDEQSDLLKKVQGKPEFALTAQAAAFAKTKQKMASECPHIDRQAVFDSKQTLEKMKAEFCNEYNLDMAHETAINVAMIYVDSDLGKSSEFKRALAMNAKFHVTDECLGSKLFDESGVSLQQLKGGWYLVIQFSKTSGYLQHEVNERCEARDYLPQTNVQLQIYADKNDCCPDTKAFGVCFSRKCTLEQNFHHHRKDMALAFRMSLIGNAFKFELSDLILEGTRFTSPNKKNSVRIGEDVNGHGAVEPDFKFSNSAWSSFRETVKGTCQGEAAKDLFAKFSDRDGTFHFECTEAKELCKCITATGLGTESIIFESKLFQVLFTGDGKFMSYTVREQRHRSRKLLMSSNNGGRC
eukprot:g3191.t1